MIRDYNENKTKAKKNVTQPRSVRVDELRVPICVTFAQNTASLLCVQAAVGMSELGVIRGDFHAVLHTK